MRAGGLLRGLRAGVFAAVCVLLASSGHAWMSGTPVPLWALAAAWLEVASSAWCLAGRERGRFAVGTLTVVTQALLHCVFSLGQAAGTHGTHGTYRTQGADGTQGMHGTGGMRGMQGMQGMQGMHGAYGMQGVAGMHGAHAWTWGMAAVHLLVALLGAWWLWSGERAVFRVARAAAARLFTPLPPLRCRVLPAAPVVLAGAARPRLLPRKLALAHVIWLRGPPGGRAVLRQHGHRPR